MASSFYLQYFTDSNVRTLIWFEVQLQWKSLLEWNSIKQQGNGMNPRSCPTTSIRGQADDVLEINRFRPTVGVDIPPSVSCSKSLITCELEYKAKLHADETNWIALTMLTYTRKTQHVRWQSREDYSLRCIVFTFTYSSLIRSMGY